MHSPADKTQENKSQSVANGETQMQDSGAATFQFIDNRPEVVAQRKLQEVANNGTLAKRAAQLQSSANQRSSLQQLSILQKGIIQAYTIEEPASVQAGAVFKSQSIKKGRYSRAYEESSKTAFKSQHHGLGDNADRTLHISEEAQTGKSDNNLGGLPSVKVSAGKKMAINNSGGQPKEFFAESTFIDAANGKLRANASRVLLKKEAKSIKVNTNNTPLVRVVPAVPVPVSVENADGLQEAFSHTEHMCNEFIKQVVDSSNRVISLLGEEDQPNIEIPTGLMGEPVEQLMDYMVNTETEDASSARLKEHADRLTSERDWDHVDTAPPAYAGMDAEKKAEMSEKFGLNEHALPNVGEGYVIASRFSEEQMTGIMQTLNAEQYLDAINQLEDIDPNLDATQQYVESNVVKGMMRLWGSHYAAVVGKDGPDSITYENYNRDTEVDWELIEIFNNLFKDFAAFRTFVGDKTTTLNLNMSTAQARQYIDEANTALEDVEAEAGSLQDQYKKAIAQAQASITTSLNSDANHKQKLIYFQMYGPGEQSFHATFKGQTSNPMTMRVTPSIKLAQKAAKDSLFAISQQFTQVLREPGSNSPWKEIFTTFFARFSNWHDAKSQIIEAGSNYKSMLDVRQSFNVDFNNWNSDLRIAIVNKVIELVGDDTIAAPTSRQDVLTIINDQKTAHEVSSLNFTGEAYRKDAIYKKLEILRLGAENLQ